MSSLQSAGSADAAAAAGPPSHAPQSERRVVSRASRGEESGITSLMRFAFHFSATVPNSISRPESRRDVSSASPARPRTFFHDIASHCSTDLSQCRRINNTATKGEQL